MPDLNAPGVAKAIARKISEDIDNYCKKAYDDGYRDHLGASLIGDPCKRKLWYSFRWCVREVLDGRVLRLFNRGHREEARFIEWLEGIGCKVWPHERPEVKDEAGNVIEKEKQFRISAVNGHFGGSLDGIAKLPASYGIEEPVLLEFKTSGTGAAFNKVAECGMEIAKPQHFAQTSTYGSEPRFNFNYCLYCIINKNDDSITVELVKLNHAHGQNMRTKAEQIINSQEPPPRLSNNPQYFDCKYCAAKDVCHEGKLPERNCRSCKYAMPIENAQWGCESHSATIPKEVIKVGCDRYKAITG